MGILIWRAYRFSWKGAIVILLFILAYNFLFFGIDLLLNWKKKTLRERFEAATPPDTIVHVLSEKFGHSNILISFNLIITLFVAYVIGSGEAINQERFYVLKEQPNYVLLRTYGDMMIAAPFERDKHLIGNSVLLLKISSKDKIELNSEVIGPLKRASDETTVKDKLKSAPSISMR